MLKILPPLKNVKLTRILRGFALFTIGTLAMGNALVGQAHAQTAAAERPSSPWKFSAGAGAGLSPDYEGSDDYDPLFLPVFDVTWNDTISIGTLGGPGIKAKVIKIQGPTPQDKFTLTTSLGYFGGRDQDDNDALAGLGNLDGGITGALIADYQIQSFGTSLSLNRDLSGDREGTSINGGIRYSLPLGFERTFLTLASSVTWADDEYMNNSFGITSAQSASSRRNLKAYTAESGIKDFDVSAMVMHRITKNIGAFGQVKYTQLTGDAADSPIVDIEGDAGQFFTFVGVTYTW